MLEEFYLMEQNIKILKYNMKTKSLSLYSISKAPFELRNALEVYNKSCNTEAKYGVIEKLNKWLDYRATNLNRKNAIKLYAYSSVSRSEDGALNLTLKYKGLSLTDNYWLRGVNSTDKYEAVNLFDTKWDEQFEMVGLRGSKLIRDPEFKSPEMSTKGSWAKCWVREKDGIYLYKADSSKDESLVEELVSRVAELLGLPTVVYKAVEYEGLDCSKCKLGSSIKESWVLIRAFGIEQDELFNFGLAKGGMEFLLMCILDGITGNIDRHDENWSLAYNSDNNKLLGLSKCYDYNFCFEDGTGSTKSQINNDYSLMELAKICYGILGDIKLFHKLKQFLKDCNSYNEYYISYVTNRIAKIESDFIESKCNGE